MGTKETMKIFFIVGDYEKEQVVFGQQLFTSYDRWYY